MTNSPTPLYWCDEAQEYIEFSLHEDEANRIEHQVSLTEEGNFSISQVWFRGGRPDVIFVEEISKSAVGTKTVGEKLTYIFLLEGQFEGRPEMIAAGRGCPVASGLTLVGGDESVNLIAGLSDQDIEDVVDELLSFRQQQVFLKSLPTLGNLEDGVCFLETTAEHFNAVMGSEFPDPKDNNIKLWVRCQRQERADPEALRIHFLDFGILVASDASFDYASKKLKGVSYGMKSNGKRYDGIDKCDGEIIFARLTQIGHAWEDFGDVISDAVNTLSDEGLVELLAHLK